MLICRRIQREMTKWLFLEKPTFACKNQVPGHFPLDTQNGDMDHTKPLGGLGGLEMELKRMLFTFSSLFPAHTKNALKWPQMGPGGFFPNNLDLADIFGRTDFNSVDTFFLCWP